MTLVAPLRSDSATRTVQLLCLAALLALVGCEDGGGLANPPEQSVASVTVVAPADAVQIGETVRLTAVALNAAGQPIGRKTFTWKSSDETVATVSQDGMMTTKREGLVVISATSEQQTGDARITITPPPPPPGIGLSPENVSFTARAGEGNPEAQTVSISNTGSGALAGLTAIVAYAAGQPSGWLAAALSGTTAPATLTLQASTAGLQPGTYNATVAIRSSTSGVTEKTVAASLVVNPAAPAAPSGLTATASGTQVSLGWADNSGTETEFLIERKAGTGGTYSQVASVGANTTSYTDAGLSHATTFSYRVRACNAGGCSGHSNEASATTVPAPVAPSAATGAASSVTLTSATLNGIVNPRGQATMAWFEWGPTASLGNSTAQQSVGNGSSDQAISANLSGLSAGTTYHFRVVAESSAGITRGTVQSFTTPQPPIVLPPAAPSGLSAEKSSNQIRLTWQDNSFNETEFRIERKQGQGGSWIQIATVGANITSYSDPAQKGPTFYYRVRACNSAGCSGYSNEADERL